MESNNIYNNKNLLITSLLISIAAIFISSCNDQQPAKTGKMYFDLAALVQKDIISDSTQNYGEEKTVLVDNINETKSLQNVDWHKELQPLSECDINKPAWKTKFSGDTV